MARMKIGIPGSYQNLIKNKTGTAREGSAIDSAYPTTNLWDDLPVTFMKTTGGSSGFLVLEYDMTSAVTTQIAAVINHNIRDASPIHIMANTVANSWGSPTHTIEFPRTAAIGGVGRSDIYQPNAWVDTSSIPARRYWALVVGSVTANDVAIAIGEFQLHGVFNTLSHNPQWGSLKELQVYPGSTLNETVAAVAWPKRGDGYRRRLVGTIETDQTGINLLQLIWNTARGLERPFLVIPDPAISDAWLVHWHTTYEKVFQYVDDFVIQIDWIEAARGGEVLAASS